MAKKKSRLNKSMGTAAKKVIAETTPAKEPVWDLDRDGITNSGLSKWLECREQFACEYIEGLTSKAMSEALEYGTIWHRCLEHQFEANPAEVARDICMEYRKHRLPELRSIVDRTTLERLLITVISLFPAYCKFTNEHDRTLKWLSREETFAFQHELPLLNPAGGLASTMPITLRGTRDGVYRDSTGAIGIFETKTRGTIDEEKESDSIRCNMQLMIYALSIRHQFGESPANCVYNIIRRPQSKPRANESLQDYGYRILAEAAKNPDHWFQRFSLKLEPADIDRFVSTTLNPLLRAFVDWWRSVQQNPFARTGLPHHYVNWNALVGKFGKALTYEYIVRGQITGCRVRTFPFPELPSYRPTASPVQNEWTQLQFWV